MLHKLHVRITSTLPGILNDGNSTFRMLLCDWSTNCWYPGMHSCIVILFISSIFPPSFFRNSDALWLVGAER